jgi:Tfp pilus assembly PilM family ATPase
MHILAIDAGSYSVKYLSTLVDRKKISHMEMSEIIIRDYMTDHRNLTTEESVNSIIQDIIDSVARPDTKIIYQADQRMMTTRFLTLPVKSKKKAELMLPFQLEEDIPFSMSDIHFSYKIEGQKTQHTALIELVKNVIFEPFYNSIRDKNILPNILTTESSVVENYFHQISMTGPYCVLDIGHSTTKAYFFFNSRLLMSHISYVGGQQINEMIAENYQISIDEAITYKHQNAFFSTTSQYSKIEPEQREFASAMDKVFSGLTGDFLRWKIGFKLNLGVNLQHIYLCGGTSNIKNIANYISEKWDVQATLLETFDKVEVEKVDVTLQNKTKYSIVNMMAIGFRHKNRFINLLTGKYAQATLSEVPLHSFAFISIRVATLTFFLAISLFAERFIIEKDIASVNSKMTSVIKNDELELPGRLRRQAVNNPKPIFDKLIKKHREVKQEISILQSAIELNSLSPLILVSQISAGNQGATLTEFKSNDTGEVTAIFSAEKLEDIYQLKKQFEQSSFSEVQTIVDKEKLQLKVSALGN